MDDNTTIPQSANSLQSNPSTPGPATSQGPSKNIFVTFLKKNWVVWVFLLVIVIVVSGVLSYYTINYSKKWKETRKKYNELRNTHCENTITQTTSTYNQQTIQDSIQETTELNNSYSILYDNKNVDYRHSYYESVNVTTLQAWQPVLMRVYGLFLIFYAVSLFVLQPSQPWLEKIKQFVLVAIFTNLYVIKILVSVVIVFYTWLKSKLPFLFMY